MTTNVRSIHSTIGEDSPRARRNDALSSHVGGDRSAVQKQHVADAVYLLIAQEGALDGAEINRLYQLRKRRNKWPLNIHFDSPRKRAGELAADGLVVILNADAPRGTPHVYALPVMEEAA